MSASEMDDVQMNSPEEDEEIIALRRKNSRRQRQQLRFAEEVEEEEKDDDDQPQKSPTNFKPPGRASRFLSIADPSIQLPGANLLRLQQLHNRAIHDGDSSASDDIPDELLDKIPFKYERSSIE